MNRRGIIAGVMALAVTLVASPAAAGSHDKDFELNGQLRARFDHLEDYDTDSNVDDNSNIWAYRALLGIGGELADNVGVHIDMQAFGTYGDLTGLTGYTGYGPTFGVSEFQSNVDVYQAFVTLGEVGGSNWELKIGRQEVTWGNELHLGDDDWWNGQTFDGVRAMSDFDSWKLDLMFLNLRETNVVSFGGTSDDDAFALAGRAMFDSEIGSWEPYIIGLRDNSDGASRVNLQTYGLLWQWDEDDTPFDASVEIALQSGELGTTASGEIDLGGTVIEADFGWDFEESGRVHLGYLMFSGDDGTDPTENESWQVIATDFHSNNRLGNLDLFALGGPLSGSLGAATGASGVEDISLGYDVQFGNDGDHSLLAALHVLNFAEIPGTADDDIGQELDLVYGYRYSENATFEVGVGTLFAGDAWKIAPTDPDPDDILRVWAGLDVVWGK